MTIRLGLRDWGAAELRAGVVSGIGDSGGVLLVNAPRHLSAIMTRYPGLPVATGRRLAWLEFMVMPCAPRVASRLAAWRVGRSGSAPHPTRIAALDAAIVERQLATLATRRARRRAQLALYAQALRQAGIEAPQLRGAGDDYLTRVLVRLAPAQRMACREALRQAGIATRLPYTLQGSITAQSHPHASRAARELLELPLSARPGADDVARIVALLTPFAAHSSSIIPRTSACSTTGS